VWRFTKVDDLFDSMLAGTVRTAALLKAQTPEALAAIRAAMAAEVEGFAANGGYALPMPSVLASAVRA
ncbi:MAG TPA: hypothetical protein VJM11_07380, partial [Nevskiaceae bacterium]|nr:hypothetical protein [Nevskiaceae bacterium]